MLGSNRKPRIGCSLQSKGVHVGKKKEEVQAKTDEEEIQPTIDIQNETIQERDDEEEEYNEDEIYFRAKSLIDEMERRERDDAENEKRLDQEIQRLREEEIRLDRERESIREVIAMMYRKHVQTLDSERSKQVNETRVLENEFFEMLYESEAIRSKSLIVQEFWRRIRVEESRRRRQIESRLSIRRQIEDAARHVEEEIRILQLKENDTAEAEQIRQREKEEKERRERELWDIESIMSEFDDMFEKSQDEEEDSATMRALKLLGSILALLYGLKWSFEFFFP